MATAGARGMRLFYSCRKFPIYARPICQRPRPQALQQLAAGGPFRMQSTSGNGQQLPPVMDGNGNGTQEEFNGMQEEETNGTQRETSTDESNSNIMDEMSDEELEEILYGRRQAESKGGGLTEVQEQVLYREGTIPAADKAMAALAASEAAAEREAISLGVQEQNVGHKWPLPERPYPERFNLKKRYHPVVEQVTRLMMKDGKLAKAQRHLAMTMNFLRMSSTPKFDAAIPLLPGTPPAPHLPLNPLLYLTVAIDSVAPLIKIHRIHGAAGGGRALEVSVPLDVRQRRRRAFMWLLDVVSKKQTASSGRNAFPHRLAQEIIAIVEGRSSVWEKRKMLHRQGMLARANNEKLARMKKSGFK